MENYVPRFIKEAYKVFIKKMFVWSMGDLEGYVPDFMLEFYRFCKKKMFLWSIVLVILLAAIIVTMAVWPQYGYRWFLAIWTIAILSLYLPYNWIFNNEYPDAVKKLREMALGGTIMLVLLIVTGFIK